MLSGDSPMNAQARKMESSNRAGSHRTRYEGNVRVCGRAPTASAPKSVEIDRDKHSLIADGNVVTEAWEQPKDDAKKKTTAPVLTESLRAAPGLHRSGPAGFLFRRREARSARNALEIEGTARLAGRFQAPIRSSKRPSPMAPWRSPARARRTPTDGDSEHIEYYTGEQKVMLNGGAPQLTRTVAGKTSRPSQAARIDLLRE